MRKIAEPERKYVSLDPFDVQKQAREDPRLFLANHPVPVIFDEIQNVPELLPYIKTIVDEARISSPEKAKGMFWLTGSQQFHLMKGVSESLAGRIGILNLYGLSNAEIDGLQSQPFLPDMQATSVSAKSPIEVLREFGVARILKLQPLAPIRIYGRHSFNRTFRPISCAMCGH